MNQNNYLVIMAGGAGTRFWPISRNANPKQFHDVMGSGRTLLQQTAERFSGICPPENIYIVTSQIYADLVSEQLPYLASSQILTEPFRRNTAACIAYACYKIGTINEKSNIVISPADHIILNETEFAKKINICLETAQNTDQLLTLGINPTRPDTGYGYINFENSDNEVKKVNQFLEKPPLENAIEYVKSGNFVWNAGIFIWTFKTFKLSFEAQMPAMAELFESGKNYFNQAGEADFINEIYPKCESISIDYALMEKANNVAVVNGEFGWSDLGTWKSLHEVSEKDDNNNSISGQVLAYDTKNSIIKTPQKLLAVVQGLDGYIVAMHEGVLMICKKEEEQNVKLFVEKAAELGDEFI
jgi:mannose-1-phosphate guanylyltransferase